MAQNKRLYYWASEPLLSRLIRRYELQEYPIEPALAYELVKKVQPVTIADDLLKTVKIASTILDISGVAGTYTVFHTVSEGKRWIIRSAWHMGTTGNSNLRVSDGTTEHFLTGWGTSAQFANGVPFPMDENMTLGMMTTGNGADSAIEVTILYEEEDAF
mgnify:CR=1 FL=1|jgi:hypothetical protein